MAQTLAKIAGIGRKELSALTAAGLHTAEDLLDAAGRPKGRAALAARTGLAEETLLALAERADLMRLPRLGADLLGLLTAAGVRSVAALRRQRPETLAAALAAAAKRRGRSSRPPGVAACARLIAAARALPRRLSY